MAVLMELDYEGTPDVYESIDNALDVKSNPPDGLIAHTARVEGDRIFILDVWESPEAFGAFAESRLGPTIAQTLGDDAPPPPQPKFTELHNAYHG